MNEFEERLKEMGEKIEVPESLMPENLEPLLLQGEMRKRKNRRARFVASGACVAAVLLVVLTVPRLFTQAPSQGDTTYDKLYDLGYITIQE